MNFRPSLRNNCLGVGKLAPARTARGHRHRPPAGARREAAGEDRTDVPGLGGVEARERFMVY